MIRPGGAPFRRRAFRVFALVALLAAAAPLRAQSPLIVDPAIQTVLFENDLARVTRSVYKPGQTLAMHDHGKGIVIAVTPFRARSVPAGDTGTTIVRKAGSVWWREPMRHTLRNTGTKRMEVIEIELKDTSAGAPVRLTRDPVRIDPRHFVREITNGLVRVLRVRVDSLGSLPMHEQLQRLEIHLTPLTASETPLAGAKRRVTARAGDVLWRPAEAHALANLAGKPAETITVEFTSPVPSSSPNVGLRRMEIGGASLYYYEKGSGEPLVLVHGECGDFRSWDGVADSLARTFHVWCYSRRYHYPNPPAAKGLAEKSPLSTQMGDLTEFIRKTGAGKVHLVGEGEGGTIVLAYALRYPRQVLSAVAAEGAFHSLLAETPDHAAYVQWRKAALDSVRAVFTGEGTARGLAAWLAFAYGDSSRERYTSAFRLAALDNAAELRRELLLAGPEPSPRCKTLPRLSPPPILLLEGDAGPAIYRYIDESFAVCLGRLKRETITGAAHDMIYTHPAEFSRLVSSFCTKRGT